MAYIKQFTNGAGFTGEYWRLTGLEINKFSDSIEARISCYKDKASRDDKLSPFAHKTFNLKLSDIDLSKEVFFANKSQRTLQRLCRLVKSMLEMFFS